MMKLTDTSTLQSQKKKTQTNLGGTRWHFIKKKIGTQICLDEDLNLGGLGIHPHPQPTQLAQLSFLSTLQSHYIPNKKEDLLCRRIKQKAIVCTTVHQKMTPYGQNDQSNENLLCRRTYISTIWKRQSCVGQSYSIL